MRGITISAASVAVLLAIAGFVFCISQEEQMESPALHENIAATATGEVTTGSNQLFDEDAVASYPPQDHSNDVWVSSYDRKKLLVLKKIDGKYEIRGSNIKPRHPERFPNISSFKVSKAEEDLYFKDTGEYLKKYSAFYRNNR